MQGGALALRQSGTVESGEAAQVYAASTKQACSLQFFPDGYEWADSEPVLLSSSGQVGCLPLCLAAQTLLHRSVKFCASQVPDGKLTGTVIGIFAVS